MKKTFKVLGLMFVLGAAILGIVHLVMLFGLTGAMRDVVLPRIKQETGLDARVGKLSINLAEGVLFLDDVEVRNPEGFLLENLASVERMRVEVDFVSLIRQKPIHVKRVEIRRALVNVVRNKKGDLNIHMLREGLAQRPAEPTGEPGRPAEPTPPGKAPEPELPAPEAKPLPEMLFDAILCKAELRYVDLKLKKLDIALDLTVIGQGLSTQRDPAVPWGAVSVVGALGDDRRSFATDLRMSLAPVTDPNRLSFDLSGKILEIDPKIMEEIYEELRIRSDPFGLEPVFHCRENRFENSRVTLSLENVRLEARLAKELGGMASVGTLRFPVAVQGTLQRPQADWQGAAMAAIGGNAGTLLDSLLKGVVEEQTGIAAVPTNRAAVVEAAVEALGKEVKAIGKSDTVKKVLKDLADGKASATNAPSPINTDTIVDLLGEQVKEIGKDEELKKDLKKLGGWLFGD
ncbi:hypothetical protein [Pontiella sp.]|uniref:hypothetical protein n=1 Tax=Pontiella sp. TaxID=2837462 RepID=UPI003564C5B3